MTTTDTKDRPDGGSGSRPENRPDGRATRPAASDDVAAEAFAQRLVGVLNDACTAVMTSIGHQTGLFESLAALDRPATSVEIADRAALDERYVREWLGAMTVARIVAHDPTSRTYRLPREHAASLTDAAGPENLARLMQYVALLAEVEQPIVECFRRGGGLPYSRYPRFHRLMAEDSAAVFDAVLLQDVVPLLPGGAERLAGGVALVDVGCGSGHAVNLLAQAFPAGRFTGLDFSEEAIGSARVEARQRGLGNASFEVQDVAAWDAEAAYDVVTAFDTIHDQAQPAEVLRRVHRALRAGGTFLMCDIAASSSLEDNLDHPVGPFLYTASTMHCMSVSLGLDGQGLGTVWGRQLAESMLRDAGFETVTVHGVDADPFNHYYVATKA
jgi:SAM-dependent methyltransferase